jgi:hypothetical protein
MYINAVILSMKERVFNTRLSLKLKFSFRNKARNVTVGDGVCLGLPFSVGEDKS